MSPRRYMWLAAAGVALLGAAGWMTRASAPTGGNVPDRASCRECRIEIDTLVHIGEPDGPQSLTGRPLGVADIGRGRLWISILDGMPLIWDSATATLRPFAREGEGPGEFRSPTFRTMLPGDSLLITDLLRYHVLTPDLQVARTLPRDMQQQVTSLQPLRWPDEMLGIWRGHDLATRQSTASFGTMSFAGDTIQTLSSVLLVQGDGSDGVAFASTFRMLGGVRPGEVWISDVNRYRVQRYSTDGQLQDSIVRALRWFPGGEGFRVGSRETPPSPRMIAHWIDDEGLHWFLAAQPREDAQRHWANMPEGMMELRVASMPADYTQFRTHVEVIDPAAKRVIARTVFDGYIDAVLPGNRVTSFIETDDGIPLLRVHRLRLQR